MPEWDRIVFVVLSVPLVVYQGYVCWQSVRERKYDAALGAVMLGLVSIVMPLLLLMTSE